MSKWSVSIQAEGDRVVELDEVVALADAVAPLGGIASGIGVTAYGAQIVIEAATSDEAVEQGIEAFASAVETARLPIWPIIRAEVIGEDEFEPDEFDIDG